MSEPGVDMTYREALDYLFGALPMFQRVGKAAYKASLENTLRLDHYFGSPHKNYPTIHVAGTNGKGSVSHMLASVLQAAGYRTGLYTSPHLSSFRERIRIDGIPLPEEEVVRFVNSHRQVLEASGPSFFEMTVAMAFDYFARRKVDVAVIETGLGGRLDSTNIIRPQLTVITNVSMDHTEFLGETLPAIAHEKGGIIKENVPLVIGYANYEVEKVLLGIAESLQAPVTKAYALLEADRIPEISCDLEGAYQEENLTTALACLEILVGSGWKVSDEQIRTGLSSVARTTGIRGRWQTICTRPRSICDVVHNREGVIRVVSQLLDTPWKNLHMVWGMSNDKDPQTTLPLLPVEASYYFCSASVPRSMDAKTLLEEARVLGLNGTSFPDVKTAYMAAVREAGPDDLIFTGGSTFVVADLLATLED